MTPCQSGLKFDCKINLLLHNLVWLKFDKDHPPSLHIITFQNNIMTWIDTTGANKDYFDFRSSELSYMN